MYIFDTFHVYIRSFLNSLNEKLKDNYYNQIKVSNNKTITKSSKKDDYLENKLTTRNQVDNKMLGGYSKGFYLSIQILLANTLPPCNQIKKNSG